MEETERWPPRKKSEAFGKFGKLLGKCSKKTKKPSHPTKKTNGSTKSLGPVGLNLRIQRATSWGLQLLAGCLHRMQSFATGFRFFWRDEGAIIGGCGQLQHIDERRMWRMGRFALKKHIWFMVSLGYPRRAVGIATTLLCSTVVLLCTSLSYLDWGSGSSYLWKTSSFSEICQCHFPKSLYFIQLHRTLFI